MLHLSHTQCVYTNICDLYRYGTTYMCKPNILISHVNKQTVYCVVQL